MFLDIDVLKRDHQLGKFSVKKKAYKAGIILSFLSNKITHHYRLIPSLLHFRMNIFSSYTPNKLDKFQGEYETYLPN